MPIASRILQLQFDSLQVKTVDGKSWTVALGCLSAG